MPLVPPRVAHRWPPSRAARRRPSAPRQAAASARSQAARGTARSGQAAPVTGEWRVRGCCASGLGRVRRGRRGGTSSNGLSLSQGRRGERPAAARRRLWAHAGGGLVERQYLLATTGWGNGRGNGRQRAMPEDTGDHRLLGDGGHDAQGATATQRTGPQLSGYCGLALLYARGTAAPTACRQIPAVPSSVASSCLRLGKCSR